MTNLLAIETHRLSKRYGPGKGTEDVTLQVGEGDVVGFLGPNGAGKSTTIRLLLGFLRPTSGSGKVLGLDIVKRSLEIRRHTGYLPGDVHLYPHLRGHELVSAVLSSRGKQETVKVKALQNRLDIDLSVRMKQCSKGMRQKIGIILALAHDPVVIILDEPTTGLDPLMQHVFLELLREEAERGKTIFFSSHYMSEVEALCNRVAIIRAGRVVTVDEISALREKRLKQIRLQFGSEPPALEGIPGLRGVKVSGRTVTLQVAGDTRPLLSTLAQSDLSDIRIEEPSLEEILLAFYSREGEK